MNLLTSFDLFFFIFIIFFKLQMFFSSESSFYQKKKIIRFPTLHGYKIIKLFDLMFFFVLTRFGRFSSFSPFKFMMIKAENISHWVVRSNHYGAVSWHMN